MKLQISDSTWWMDMFSCVLWPYLFYYEDNMIKHDHYQSDHYHSNSGGADGAGGANIVIVLSLLKLVRMWRLARDPTYMLVACRTWNTGRLGRLVLLILLFGHFCGAIWFYVTDKEKTVLQIVSRDSIEFADYYTDSSTSASTTSLHISNEYLKEQLSFYDLYAYSLQHGMIMFLGRMNSTGNSPGENLLFAFVAPVGIIIQSVIFSKMSMMYMAQDQHIVRQQQLLVDLRASMKMLRLPLTLRSRILSFFTYQRVHRNQDFLGVLHSSGGGQSQQLKWQLALTLYRDLLDPDVVGGFCLPTSSFAALQAILLALKDEICLPGDYICKEGDEGTGMYFLLKGELIVSSKGETLAVLQKGQFFGDLSLLTGLRRTASVRANTFCTLAFLSKQAMAPILQKYPSQMELMASVFRKTVIGMGGGKPPPGGGPRQGSNSQNPTGAAGRSNPSSNENYVSGQQSHSGAPSGSRAGLSSGGQQKNKNQSKQMHNQMPQVVNPNIPSWRKSQMRTQMQDQIQQKSKQFCIDPNLYSNKDTWVERELWQRCELMSEESSEGSGSSDEQSEEEDSDESDHTEDEDDDVHDNDRSQTECSRTQDSEESPYSVETSETFPKARNGRGGRQRAANYRNNDSTDQTSGYRTSGTNGSHQGSERSGTGPTATRGEQSRNHNDYNSSQLVNRLKTFQSVQTCDLESGDEVWDPNADTDSENTSGSASEGANEEDEKEDKMNSTINSKSSKPSNATTSHSHRQHYQALQTFATHAVVVSRETTKDSTAVGADVEADNANSSPTRKQAKNKKRRLSGQSERRVRKMSQQSKLSMRSSVRTGNSSIADSNIRRIRAREKEGWAGIIKKSAGRSGSNQEPLDDQLSLDEDDHPLQRRLSHDSLCSELMQFKDNVCSRHARHARRMSNPYPEDAGYEPVYGGDHAPVLNHTRTTSTGNKTHSTKSSPKMMKGSRSFGTSRTTKNLGRQQQNNNNAALLYNRPTLEKSTSELTTEQIPADQLLHPQPVLSPIPGETLVPFQEQLHLFPRATTDNSCSSGKKQLHQAQGETTTELMQQGPMPAAPPAALTLPLRQTQARSQVAESEVVPTKGGAGQALVETLNPTVDVLDHEDVAAPVLENDDGQQEKKRQQASPVEQSPARSITSSRKAKDRMMLKKKNNFDAQEVEHSGHPGVVSASAPPAIPPILEDIDVQHRTASGKLVRFDLRKTKHTSSSESNIRSTQMGGVVGNKEGSGLHTNHSSGNRMSDSTPGELRTNSSSEVPERTNTSSEVDLLSAAVSGFNTTSAGSSVQNFPTQEGDHDDLRRVGRESKSNQDVEQDHFTFAGTTGAMMPVVPTVAGENATNARAFNVPVREDSVSASKPSSTVGNTSDDMISWSSKKSKRSSRSHRIKDHRRGSGGKSERKEDTLREDAKNSPRNTVADTQVKQQNTSFDTLNHTARSSRSSKRGDYDQRRKEGRDDHEHDRKRADGYRSSSGERSRAHAGRNKKSASSDHQEKKRRERDDNECETSGPGDHGENNVEGGSYNCNTKSGSSHSQKSHANTGPGTSADSVAPPAEQQKSKSKKHHSKDKHLQLPRNSNNLAQNDAASTLSDLPSNSGSKYSSSHFLDYEPLQQGGNSAGPGSYVGSSVAPEGAAIGTNSKPKTSSSHTHRRASVTAGGGTTASHGAASRGRRNSAAIMNVDYCLVDVAMLQQPPGGAGSSQDPENRKSSRPSARK
ncbi:unnamed protein product [Amoebophrya sp. A120]|nr:unnamed protein product [Amoebophrya sp. A120]|eukprot:GSA120T00009271001.1